MCVLLNVCIPYWTTFLLTVKGGAFERKTLEATPENIHLSREGRKHTLTIVHNHIHIQCPLLTHLPVQPTLPGIGSGINFDFKVQKFRYGLITQ